MSHYDIQRLATVEEVGSLAGGCRLATARNLEGDKQTAMQRRVRELIGRAMVDVEPSDAAESAAFLEAALQPLQKHFSEIQAGLGRNLT